jgi:hypothetical protein
MTIFIVTYFASDAPDRDLQHQAQTNQHAFLAKLSTYDIPELNQIGRAGFTLRSTCEFAPWELVHFPRIEELYDSDDDDNADWPKRRDLELERVSIKILNVKVPAAAQWIRHVGQRLYEMQGNLEGEYEWQNEALNSKWTGAKGYSKERFRSWRERFEWISTVTALEKETQRIARECARRMAEIESM